MTLKEIYDGIKEVSPSICKNMEGTCDECPFGICPPRHSDPGGRDRDDLYRRQFILASSHFNTVRDSWKIYKEILRFSASSFAGFVVNYRRQHDRP